MSQLPEKDAKCEAADKATEDLRKKRNERTDKIFAQVQAQTDAQKKAALLNAPPRSIYTPTEDESQSSFKEYTEDAGRRLEHDHKFPKEPRQIKPGEILEVLGGFAGVTGVERLTPPERPARASEPRRARRSDRKRPLGRKRRRSTKRKQVR